MNAASLARRTTHTGLRPHTLALALRAALPLITVLAASSTAPSVQAQTAEASLPVVRTSAQAEKGKGEIIGVAAQRSATGTKSDAAIIEVPQSITVIGAAEIEQRAATNIKEAIGYSSGVTPSISYDAREDLISFRGFPFDWASGFQDGLQMPSSTYANAMVEPYGLERVEVLKGPASMLYGASPTGGILNLVSKRPTATSNRELQVQVGDHQRRQLAGDFSGALGAEWAYRLTGLMRESGSEIEFVRDDRRFFAPALSWRPTGATRLTLLASWQEDDLGASGGTQAFLPASGIARPNPNGKIARHTNGGEPGFDFYKKEQRSFGWELEQQLGDKLQLEHALRLRDVDLRYQTGYGGGIDPADATQRRLLRSTFGSFGGNQSFASDTRLLGKFGTTEFEHSWVAGLDLRQTKVDERNYFGDAPSIDIFAPVYGATMVLPATPYADQAIKNRQVGLYVQDQIRFDRHIVTTLGLRWDSSRNEVTNRQEAAASFTKKENKLTARVGVNYLFDNGLAPYASLATSFTPTLAANSVPGGKPFDARTGKQFELGLKYQPPGSDTLVTAALFDIRQRNTLTLHPDQANFPFAQVQSGEYRSRGFEAEGKTRLDLGGPKALSVIGAYTYLDAKYTKAAPGADALPVTNVGNAPKGVAKHSASLWLDWRLPATLGLPGLSVAAGARHIGERPNDDMTNSLTPDSRFMLPAVTVFDAAVRYEQHGYQLALNLGNVTDKTTTDCWGDRCWYGAGRSFRATLAYRW